MQFPHLVRYHHGAHILFTRPGEYLCVWSYGTAKPQEWASRACDGLPVHHIVALETDDFAALHRWLDANCPSWYLAHQHYISMSRDAFFELPFEEQQKLSRIDQESQEKGMQCYLFVSDKEAALARMFYGTLPDPSKPFIFG